MTPLQDIYRIWLAEQVMSQSLHLAWGIGDDAWTSPPAVDGTETALRNEIGRRVVTRASYVIPDDAGAISIVIDGDTFRFTASDTPTRHIYIKTDFGYDEAIGSGVREIGLFSATVTNPSLPPSQKYFTPDQIVSPGRMLLLQNKAPIYRFPDNRERFEFVISF